MEAVTRADKTRSLIGSVDIQTACHGLRLVCDHPRTPSSHMNKSGDQIRGKILLIFHKTSVVRQRFDHRLHVIGLSGIFGNQFIQKIVLPVPVVP